MLQFHEIYIFISLEEKIPNSPDGAGPGKSKRSWIVVIWDDWHNAE